MSTISVACVDFAGKFSLTMRCDLMAAVAHSELRLTVRLGGMTAVGIAILAALIKL